MAEVALPCGCHLAHHLWYQPCRGYLVITLMLFLANRLGYWFSFLNFSWNLFILCAEESMYSLFPSKYLFIYLFNFRLSRYFLCVSTDFFLLLFLQKVYCVTQVFSRVHFSSMHSIYIWKIPLNFDTEDNTESNNTELLFQQ